MSYTRAFHYTKFIAAGDIVQSGSILRSKGYHNEIEAVWFSTNPRFDYGSGMHVRRGQEVRELSWEMLTTKIGLARFVTDAKLLIPYPEAIAAGLIQPYAVWYNNKYVGQYSGSTDDWLIHPNADFPLRICTGAELFLRDQWVKMTPETIEEMAALLPRTVGATWSDLFGPGARKRRQPKKRKRKK